MAIKRRGGNEAASTASDGSTASNIRKQQSHPRLLTSALLLGALLLAGYAAKQGFYLHSGPKSDPGTRAERDENGGAGEEAAAATETAADAPVADVPTRLDVLSRWDPVEVNHTRLLIPNYLADDECELIKKLAMDTGMFTSDFVYLDGSNKNDRGRQLEKETMSEAEANKHFRLSDQTWIANDENSKAGFLLERAKTLARLPDSVAAEMLQVVKYSRHGHYESHFDSEGSQLGPCCMDPVARGMQTGSAALDNPLNKRCRLCRFITILYYLDDVEEGGGTIFPLADQPLSALRQWKRMPDYKQTQQCSEGLRVDAAKGKAVLFYNHKVSDDGYLGEIDVQSLHGGCNVIKGTKWLANHWISALPSPGAPRKPASSHYATYTDLIP